MPRIRTVKPELHKHLKLFELEEKSELPIRLAFISLFSMADRRGIFEWIPRQLKIDCLPYDDVNFADVLDALATGGFVVKYTIDNRDYGLIPGFRDHQFINNKEKPSLMPDPPPELTSTRSGRVADALPSGKERDGNESPKERKGKEGKVPESTRGFTPPTLDEVKQYCRENNYNINPEKFMHHYGSNGWKVGKNKMVSWKSAVGGWSAREPSNVNDVAAIGGR